MLVYAAGGARDTQFTCFAGTKVQMLTQLLQVHRGKSIAVEIVYLLYWYKSTNTDAAAAGE
jgi:hypothetical protein